MRVAQLMLTCLACAALARRVQVPSAQNESHEGSLKPSEAIASLLLSSTGSAAFVPTLSQKQLTSPRVSDRWNQLSRFGVSDLPMDGDKEMVTVGAPFVDADAQDEAIAFGAAAIPDDLSDNSATISDLPLGDSDDEAIVGAAAVGGLCGLQFFGGLIPMLLWALIFAYVSTFPSDLGNATKSVGEFAAKAYFKALEVNEEFEVIPQFKNAVDRFGTAAKNLAKNYGIADQIDAKFEITEKYDSVTSWINDRLDDLKPPVKDSSDELAVAQ